MSNLVLDGQTENNDDILTSGVRSEDQINSTPFAPSILKVSDLGGVVADVKSFIKIDVGNPFTINFLSDGDKNYRNLVNELINHRNIDKFKQRLIFIYNTQRDILDLITLLICYTLVLCSETEQLLIKDYPNDSPLIDERTFQDHVFFSYFVDKSVYTKDDILSLKLYFIFAYTYMFKNYIDRPLLSPKINTKKFDYQKTTMQILDSFKNSHKYYILPPPSSLFTNVAKELFKTYIPTSLTSSTGSTGVRIPEDIYTPIRYSTMLYPYLFVNSKSVLPRHLKFFTDKSYLFTTEYDNPLNFCPYQKMAGKFKNINKLSLYYSYFGWNKIYELMHILNVLSNILLKEFTTVMDAKASDLLTYNITHSPTGVSFDPREDTLFYFPNVAPFAFQTSQLWISNIGSDLFLYPNIHNDNKMDQLVSNLDFLRDLMKVNDENDNVKHLLHELSTNSTAFDSMTFVKSLTEFFDIYMDTTDEFEDCKEPFLLPRMADAIIRKMKAFIFNETLLWGYSLGKVVDEFEKLCFLSEVQQDQSEDEGVTDENQDDTKGEQKTTEGNDDENNISI